MPERVYALSLVGNSMVDLRVEPCEGVLANHPALAGKLQRVEPQPISEIGVAVPLTEETSITVAQIAIVGPGQDTTLPPDSARIIIRIAAPNLDWPTYAPTLLLADGTVAQSPEQAPTEGGIELRYLVPLPAGDLDLAWQVTLPQTSQVMRWRTTLHPPLDRALVLRQSLDAQSTEVIRQANGGLALGILLTNHGKNALTLSRDDVVLRRGSESLSLPELPELQTPLAPGEARTLTISLPETDSGTPLVLSVGSYRWQITY
jgi:hypothetical protein